MDVAVGGLAVRRLVREALDATPAESVLWSRRALLALVDAADTLADLRTTASARLVRLSRDSQSGFRYINAEAALYLYPIHTNGEQMSTSLGANSLDFVRAVKLVAIQ